MQLVSPRVGLIRSLTRSPRGPIEPNPPIIYHALLSHFDFKRAKQSERIAAGKGASESEAIGSAIGEAVERYCASHVNQQALRHANWQEVASSAISPAECVLYSPHQYARKEFPFAEWKEATEIDWFSARELPSENEVLAPALLIYMGYRAKNFEGYICQSTSNGLAAGPDLHTAIRNGLYELIERDGFLICWMNRLSMPEVDFSQKPGLARNIRTHYERFGVETRIFNLTTDLPIYVMMALSLNPSGQGPAAMVGLGCHSDPSVAVIKALLEICQIRPSCARKYVEEPPQQRLRSYEDVRTLDDHSAFFMMPERLNELSFLLQNGCTQQLEDLPNHSLGSAREDLHTCVAALNNAGCRVIYADLTTPDLVDFKIRVVRTIATGLQPIHFGHGQERLGGLRLYEVPRRLGYTSDNTTEASLNPCPHPLA